MGKLRDWILAKAEEDGFEIDADELDKLGLSDDAPSGSGPDGDVLSIELPGEAAGAVELFAAADVIKAKEGAVEKDGLMWEPIIRTGQWAVRPGGKTGKRRSPLKVVAGHSKDQRKEIGLQDLVDAFNDRAIEYVTVPTSHANHVLENTGFIKGLKIANGTYTPKGKTDSVACKVLMGGYDIRKSNVKASMLDGTIASRSAGILYDYVDTESGKTYPAALEHVALTNKPWITGMTQFGRRIASAVKGKELAPVGLSLSNDEPDEEEFLAQEDALDGIELAAAGSTATIARDHEQSPNWLQTQVSQLLDQARAAKRAARQQKQTNGLYVDDPVPYYRCVEARPGEADDSGDLKGSALISDGWGDSANFWIAPITVKDGTVNLAKFTEWQSTKKVWVADDRPAPPKNMEPLDKSDQTSEPEILSRRELAIRARKDRARGEQQDIPAGASAAGDQIPTQPPRGGEHMAGQDDQRLGLSDEAQRAIEAAEARATAAEKTAEQLSKQVERLSSSVVKSDAETRIAQLKADGFTEERGFGGVLAYARKVYLADDGEPAVQSDHLATDGNATGELSLSQVMDGLFAAFKRGEDGKLALGDQLAEPAEKTGKEGEEESVGEKADDTTKLADGKPGGKDGSDDNKVDFANLSREEQDRILAEELSDTPLADFVPKTEVKA